MSGSVSICRRLIISGRVQGVGFRWFTRTKAQQLGLKGWVRNLPDRKVEVLAVGSENLINIFIEILREGPALSRVDSIQVLDEIQDQEYSSFSII